MPMQAPPRSMPEHLRPLRLPPPGETNRRGDVRVRELAPQVSVARAEALVEVAIQPGVEDAREEQRRRHEMKQVYEAPPATLVELTGGWVDGAVCLAFTSRGRYVVDSLRTRRQAIACGFGRHEAKRGLVLPRDRRTVKLRSPAILVGAPTGGSYFHWLVEAVSREVLVRGIVPPGTKILVGRLRRMERAALDAAGIGEERVVQMQPNTLVRVPQLYVPSRGTQTPARLIPASMAALHSLSEGLASGRPPTRERIFISRAKARYRRIVNEDEVIALLENRGFARLALEKLTPAEQIYRFANAEAVIGVHGAGFVNTVFSNSGATVIELQPPRLDPTRIQLFWNLAAVMRHRYAQVVCSEAPGSAGHPSSRDVVVDCRELAALLDRLAI